MSMAYASGGAYPLGKEEEMERDAAWLEARGLDRSRQKVHEFVGEVTDRPYGTDLDVPPVKGVGYPSFVVYPDYVEVHTVPLGSGHREEELIREAWRSYILLCNRVERIDAPTCGNKTMDFMMEGMAGMGRLALSTALAHAVTNSNLWEAAVPTLLDMGADPNDVVFVSTEGYTTPLMQAVSGIGRRYYGRSCGYSTGPDGSMYSTAASSGSALDMMLEAGGNPFKAVLAPDLPSLRLNNLHGKGTYRYTQLVRSVLDGLCSMASNMCFDHNGSGEPTTMEDARGRYALAAVIDRIAGRDPRFLEFLHCGAFSGCMMLDRVPRYHPGELATRIHSGGSAMMTSYAAMIGLVPRTADVYGPGCYSALPGPSCVSKRDESHEYAEKAWALFNAGLSFEWDGKWGMDMGGNGGMGQLCPSRACYLGNGDMSMVTRLGSSLMWLAGRPYPTAQWTDGNLLDTVVALGANVDGCRTETCSDGTVKSSCPSDETFIRAAIRTYGWDQQYPDEGKTSLSSACRLLEMGADPNVRSSERGDTPMIALAKEFASRYSTCGSRTSMLQMLRRLIAHGADPNVTNDTGHDALRMLVLETKESLWGTMISEKARAQQLIEFAQELVAAGIDLDRKFTVDGVKGKVSHEYGLDHPLSQFIAAARGRLHEIDRTIAAERDRIEAEAAAGSKQ